LEPTAARCVSIAIQQLMLLAVVAAMNPKQHRHLIAWILPYPLWDCQVQVEAVFESSSYKSVLRSLDVVHERLCASPRNPIPRILNLCLDFWRLWLLPPQWSQGRSSITYVLKNINLESYERLHNFKFALQYEPGCSHCTFLYTLRNPVSIKAFHHRLQIEAVLSYHLILTQLPTRCC
jgi:hypothetical protein